MRRVLTGLALVILAVPALAGDANRGTAEEAQAMVAAAVAYLDANGADAMIDKLNNDPRPDFYDRDLYVFMIGEDGIIVAHAANDQIVGQDGGLLSDVDGTPFGRMMLDQATPEGVWIDYRWEDPTSGNVEPKSSWVVRHNGYILGCGVYKP